MKTRILSALLGIVGCVLVGSASASVYYYDDHSDPLTGTVGYVADRTGHIAGAVADGASGVTDAVFITPVNDLLY